MDRAAEININVGMEVGRSHFKNLKPKLLGNRQLLEQL